MAHYLLITKPAVCLGLDAVCKTPCKELSGPAVILKYPIGLGFRGGGWSTWNRSLGMCALCSLLVRVIVRVRAITAYSDMADVKDRQRQDEVHLS